MDERSGTTDKLTYKELTPEEERRYELLAREKMYRDTLSLVYDELTMMGFKNITDELVFKITNKILDGEAEVIVKELREEKLRRQEAWVSEKAHRDQISLIDDARIEGEERMKNKLIERMRANGASEQDILALIGDL